MSQYPDAQFTLDTRVRPVRIIEEYTPRSKSLDLLRSTTTPSPISAARNSLDTISTLKGGHSRISSPIFLNSSVGVKPLPPALSAEQQLDESGSGSETLNSSPPSHGELRSATMPRTPSRRHEESEQLKSKFSMSPIQQSKRSKARFSQDRTSVEGVIGQEGGRGTFGNWSHSLGMAAKKLHKSTTTRKGSNDTLDVHLEVNEVTPEKSKAALRTATSLASIRRFITPSRRTRKVSTTGLARSRSRPMVTVDDDENAWIDAEGRQSRDGLNEPRKAMEGGSSIRNSYLMVPRLDRCSSRVSSEVTAARRPPPISAAFFDPPPQLAEAASVSLPTTTTPQPSVVRESTDEHSPPPAPPAQGTSKLKTLHLLAKRPFNAFGKKMREMDVSWWPSSRGSQDLPDRSGLVVHEKVQAHTVERVQGTRRSEDLLSKASPRACDTSTMAVKSRSMEMDRILLPSKVVPLRSAGVGATHKRRPTIPDAFAKPLPPPLPRPEVRQADKPTPSTTVGQQPRISDLRHPWMRQLQLASTSACTVGQGVHSAIEARERHAWPSSAEASIPTFSLTAATRPSAPPDFPATAQGGKKQSPRRPPASLLGQSLPIPPRSLRSRASTISSQSSTTSSPSGKVIVSRRSYGPRLRSPSTPRGETGSIRSVGTSILFTSPPGSPAARRFVSPYATRSPSATRIRSPPKGVLLPKYSPHRGGQRLHRKPSSAFSDDSERDETQEWVDEGPTTSPATTMRSRLENILPPPKRPGFIEMNEATQTLSQLVKTFSNSSGSLSLNASPYKKHDAGPSPKRGLYGIMEADEAPPPAHLRTRERERLMSLASMVSTEANSSFEDSEELQKLLDSIMAADLGNGSADMSGDMALLSPFGSPVEYKDGGSSENREVGEKAKPQMSPLPKFLLNDRPISPPDSTSVHGHQATEAGASVEEKIKAFPSKWEPAVPTAPAVTYRGCGSISWKADTHDDSGYASCSVLDTFRAQ